MFRVLFFLIASFLISSKVQATATPYGKEFIKLQSLEANLSPIMRHVEKIRESTDGLVIDSTNDLPCLASSDLGPYASDLMEYHQQLRSCIAPLKFLMPKRQTKTNAGGTGKTMLS